MCDKLLDVVVAVQHILDDTFSQTDLLVVHQRASKLIFLQDDKEIQVGDQF